MSRAPAALLVGMDREAAVVRRAFARLGLAQPPVYVTGGIPDETTAQARRAAADGAGALVSLGLAGGLDPRLPPGSVILADSVLHPAGLRQPCEGSFGRALRAALPAAAGGAVLGVDRAVASVAEKRRLHAQTGAVALDMESHRVAEVAAERALPFAVLRAVADGAGTAVPQAALAGLGPDGRTRPLRVAAALLGRPGDLPGLLRLAREAGRAEEALFRALLLCGGLLSAGVEVG